MAEIFQFGIGVPEATEAPVAEIRCYESADGQTAWGLVGSIAVAALPAPVGGLYTWATAAADPGRWHQLVPVSAGGVERGAGAVLPPRPTTPETFVVYAWTVDAGLGIKSGVSFTARPKRAHTAAGARLVVAPASVITDVGGYAALTLPADAGILWLALGPVSAEVDTTGRARQVVNLKDLV